MQSVSHIITRSILYVLLLIGLSNTAWAREPETYPESGAQVFLGLDDTSAPTRVQDGRAQDLQNVTLDISRSLRQRFGNDLIGDILDEAGEDFCAVTGLYYAKFSSGTERIINICSDRLKFLDGSEWTEISAPPITTGQDNQFVFTTALDNIIGTNNDDIPFKYDGTTAGSLSFTGLTDPIEKAQSVIWFKNFLIFGFTTENGTAHPTRIRWSNVGTIETWTDADFIDISALGGQEINCMAELYDNVYIGLTDSLYKVSLVGGADLFNISKVTDDIGCVAKNSMQSITLTNAQNGLIFLDKDKRIYFFNGVIAQDISQFITKTMGALSGSRLEFAVSADTNKSYLLSVTSGTGTENNLVLDLQYEIGEWTKHVNIDANAMAKVIDDNTNDQVYFGNYKAFVYQSFDSDQRDDVGTATGTVTSVELFDTSTASGLTVLNTSTANYVTGALVGAPISLIGGTGAGQTSFIADNTTTGLVITDTLSPNADNTTTFEVGAIDSFYTTKWYDMGQSARLKHFGEIYFWADADVSSTISISYATDFNSDISTQSIAFSSSTTDAIWGSAVWGVALWGAEETVFRQLKLESQGRYLRIKWAEDDPEENFYIYGWVPVFWSGDIL